MRLRLLVPRRGRRAGFGGLAGGLAAALLASALLAGCGGGQAPKPPIPPPFALGVTESNPHLLAPGPQPPPFGVWRDRLAALHPYYVRVLVDWSHVQPVAGRPPDWAAPQDGCMRGLPPCAGWAGVRDTLRAVKAMGAVPVLVLYGTPAWAAQPATGCERPGTGPYERAPQIGPYRALVRSLLDLGRREGVELPWWSPWNEPNLPAFLNPQRASCDPASPTLAAGAYVPLVRALRAELAAAGGVHDLLLGEAAGIPEARPHATGAAELARALPDDVVCGAGAWAQHAYLVRPRGGGAQLEGVAATRSVQVLASVEAALAAHGCDHLVPIWMTETGVGDAPEGCARMAARLRAWRADPQVRAAFQYTFREDPAFPVGLAGPDLRTLYPAYLAWLTRGDSSCT